MGEPQNPELQNTSPEAELKGPTKLSLTFMEKYAAAVHKMHKLAGVGETVVPLIIDVIQRDHAGIIQDVTEALQKVQEEKVIGAAE